jgi:hypothetical protein
MASTRERRAPRHVLDMFVEPRFSWITSTPAILSDLPSFFGRAT